MTPLVYAQELQLAAFAIYYKIYSSATIILCLFNPIGNQTIRWIKYLSCMYSLIFFVFCYIALCLALGHGLLSLCFRIFVLRLAHAQGLFSLYFVFYLTRVQEPKYLPYLMEKIK